MWQQEINRLLLQYRTTPHSTTKVSPAELLFNKVVQGAFPSLKKSNVVDRHKEARENELSSQRYNKQFADNVVMEWVPDLLLANPCDLGINCLESDGKTTCNLSQTPISIYRKNTEYYSNFRARF